MNEQFITGNIDQPKPFLSPCTGVLVYDAEAAFRDPGLDGCQDASHFGLRVGWIYQHAAHVWNGVVARPVVIDARAYIAIGVA